MNAARELLDRLADLGAKVERRGNKLVLKAGTIPVPKALVATCRARKGDILLALSADNLEERAALIEEGAKVPRLWAEGFAKLCTMPRPESVQPRCWQQLIDNAGRFIDRFAHQARSLGWDTGSVLGCHLGKPDARFDMQGLVWRIEGGELVMITEATAQIRKPSGDVLTYRRHAPDPREPMVMAWELAKTGGSGNAE
jgi:hypothetical protein